MDFQVNQIVKGKFGTFVILGFRSMLGNEQYAVVKEIDPSTQATYPGQIALPISSLRPANVI